MQEAKSDHSGQLTHTESDRDAMHELQSVLTLSRHPPSLSGHTILRLSGDRVQGCPIAFTCSVLTAVFVLQSCFSLVNCF